MRHRVGNKLLADHRLDSRLLAEEPDHCAALLGLTINILHLLASVLAPYVPGVSESLAEQLRTEPKAVIPDQFDAGAIKPGHKLGTPSPLFTLIPDDKVAEWREVFGGEEAGQAKAEAAAAAAAKKAAKEREKERKRLQKQRRTAADAAGAVAPGPSVEHGEKELIADPAVEQLTHALDQTEVHTS